MIRCKICNIEVKIENCPKSNNSNGYLQRCKPCHNKKARESYARRDPTNKKIYSKKYREENKHWFKEWREAVKNDPEKNQRRKDLGCVRMRIYRKEIKANGQYQPQKEKYRLRISRAKRRLKNITWSEFNVYRELCELFTNGLGEIYVMDHVIPIKNDRISGLDVPWNIQIIPKAMNDVKGSSFDGTYENRSWIERYNRLDKLTQEKLQIWQPEK